jgi:hypothetical protein
MLDLPPTSEVAWTILQYPDLFSMSAENPSEGSMR